MSLDLFLFSMKKYEVGIIVGYPIIFLRKYIVPNQEPWSLFMPNPIFESSSCGIRNPDAGVTRP